MLISSFLFAKNAVGDETRFDFGMDKGVFMRNMSNHTYSRAVIKTIRAIFRMMS